MKKKLSAFFLVLVMTVTAALSPVRAEGASGPLDAPPVTEEMLEDAVKVITNAANELERVFTPAEASRFSEIFSSIQQAFGTVGSLVTPVNGVITFLKLVGLISDSSAEGIANIQNQLLIIGEQLTDMDRKLNDLTVRMAAIQASAEFNTRTEKAIMLRSNWKDFAYRYMEESMDELMTRYNSMILNGMQAWCRNEGNARTANGVDNTEFSVVYRAGEKEGLILQFGFAEPEDGDIVYRIGAEILPQKVTWDVSNYRGTIRDAIIAGIAKAAEEGTLDESLKAAAHDAALVRSIAEDAVSVLAYRVAASEVNKDSSFSLQVIRQFNNFCNHLLASEEGIEAVTNAMFLTHAFEYEIAEDYTQFFNEMILKAGVYGAFVTEVLGLSAYVTDAEKSAELGSFIKVIETLERSKLDGLTGCDNYCYITGCCLAFGEICFENDATVKTFTRGTAKGYEEASLKSTSVTVSYDGRSTSNTGVLIGDADALLLQYMLRANGMTPDFAYYNKYLAAGKSSDFGRTVVSLVGEKALPLDSAAVLSARNIIGDYFRTGSSVSLKALPDGADSDDIVARRMMQGSVTDNKTGVLSANELLSAIAVYGESHFYWETDEAAVLGGPNSNPGFAVTYSNESGGVEYPNIRHIVHHYHQQVVYNALVKVPCPLSDARERTPLSAYAELCKGLFGERPEVKTEKMDDETAKASFFNRYGIWIAAGSAAAGIAALAVVAIRRKKKKKNVK